MDNNLSNSDQSSESQLLKKKTGRSKEINRNSKDFDLDKYKEQILSEYKTKYIYCNQRKVSEFIPDKLGNLISEYEARYKKYVQEEMNSNLILLVNRVILESTKLNINLRISQPLQKYLINIIKKTLMNKLEIAYFSILLDNLGWETEGFELEDNLLMIGLVVKMFLGDCFEFIFEYFSQTKNNLSELFNNWLQKTKGFNHILISPRELNIKYNNLLKPSNPFCKNDFIDFNYSVDQILQMSLPYSENKNQKKKQKTFDSFRVDESQTKKILKSNISKVFPSLYKNNASNDSIPEITLNRDVKGNEIQRQESIGITKYPENTNLTLQKSGLFNDNLFRNDSGIFQNYSEIFGNQDQNFNLFQNGFAREYSQRNFKESQNELENDKATKIFFNLRKQSVSNVFDDKKNYLITDESRRLDRFGLEIPFNSDYQDFVSTYRKNSPGPKNYLRKEHLNTHKN